MLSLRTIGIVFEKRDTIQKIDDGIELSPAEHALMDISLTETFHYCFFNLNITSMSTTRLKTFLFYNSTFSFIFSAPYYTFKTFHDYFNLPFARSASVVSWIATRNRILTLFGLFSALMFLQTYWPVTAIVTEEFYTERTLLYRILYIYPMILIFRIAFFTVSLSSELFLFITGFGAYPVESEPKTVVGPTKPITQEMIDNCRHLKYSYITIETNDILKIEMTSSFYVVVKNWNKTVQWFIANNIFKRLPYKAHPIPSRLVTFIISVFWHGNDIGYFCTLLPGIGILVLTQKMIEKTFLEASNSIKGKFLATILLHVIKHSGMGYLIMSTWLQSLERCWRYYSSIHHIGLVIFLSIYLMALFVNVNRRKNVIVGLQKRLNSFLL